MWLFFLFHGLVVQNLNHLDFESFLYCRSQAYFYKFQVQTKLYTHILIPQPYYFAGKSIFLINILCLRDIFHLQSINHFTKWGFKVLYVLQGQHVFGISVTVGKSKQDQVCWQFSHCPLLPFLWSVCLPFALSRESQIHSFQLFDSHVSAGLLRAFLQDILDQESVYNLR